MDAELKIGEAKQVQYDGKKTSTKKGFHFHETLFYMITDKCYLLSAIMLLLLFLL